MCQLFTIVYCFLINFNIVYPRFNQVQLLQDGGIPTKSFLLACNSILPIFGELTGVVENFDK